MNKKYIIYNSKDLKDYLSCYLFYIILACIVICLFNYFFNSYNENFATITSSPTISVLTKEDVSTETTESYDKNQILQNKLNVLQEKIELQNRLQNISNNYLKINDSSFPDELKMINLYFASIDLPELDLSTYNIISSKSDYDALVNAASTFVNFYKPGDIVTNNSSFNIDKNTICYKNIKDPAYISTHPDCMVCSINSEYKNTSEWLNTKTNIKNVCLFDKNSKENSGIPNLSECKQLCNINS